MLKYLLFILGLAPIPALSEAFPASGSSRSSCESLWLERNQIYNAAGKCFDTALGQAVFDNGDCGVGPPSLSESALNRISQIEQAEAGRGCNIDTARDRISVYGRYGALVFGRGGQVLGRWPQALQQLDVFPAKTSRERSCTVGGLSSGADGFLAIRSGPDVRYPQIGQVVNGDRISSSSACMGRWCFADTVQSAGRSLRLNGWFHVRWCQP